MAKRTKEGVSSQVQSESRDLTEASGLPFRELLSSEKVQAALDRAGVKFRDRVFNPMVTLWAFLSQVMAGDKGTCENATSRVLADRVAHGKTACSTDSSSYCEARRRLPTRVIAELAREMGQALDLQSESEWLFNGRSVKIVDGSTATILPRIKQPILKVEIKSESVARLPGFSCCASAVQSFDGLGS